jgi:hypothetical protein
MREGREEKDWFLSRAKLEVPPLGYTGSLAGTGWDQDTMLSEYDQAAGSIRRGSEPVE